MLFRYCKTYEGGFIVGPLGSNGARIRKKYDTFSSMRSPIDESESNFVHISSNWAPVSLDSSSAFTAYGKGLKFTCNSKVYIADQGITFGGAYIGPQVTIGPWQDSGILTRTYMRAYRYGFDERLGLGVAKQIYWGRSGTNPLAYRYSISTSSMTLIDVNSNTYRRLGNMKYTLNGRTSWPYQQAVDIFYQLVNATVDEDWQRYQPFYAKATPLKYDSTVTSIEFNAEANLLPPIHQPNRVNYFQDRLDRGDMSLDCVSQVKAFQANTAIVASKLPSLPSLGDAFPSNRKDLSDPKMWSNMYLAYKYGVKLTLRDGEDILSGIGRRMSRQKAEYSTRRATVSHSSPAETLSLMQFDELHMKLKYFVADNTMVKAIRGLYDYNLMPTIGTAWDLIPYSFVVDWCLNVSECLAAIDYGPQYATLSVKSATYSKLTTVTGPVHPIEGYWTPTLGTTTYYSRDVKASADEPIPRFTASLPTTQNVVTGAALYIQRRL